MPKEERPLIDPRELTKANSYFYDEEEEQNAKFYSTMTIIIALKKDFRRPGEKESNEKEIMESGNEMSKSVLLSPRVDYLLEKMGFKTIEMPKFWAMDDDDDYLVDYDYELQIDDLRENYYFLWAERSPIYQIWKICDFIYSYPYRTRTKRIQEIYDMRVNWVEDKLIFLYAVYGEET